MKKIITISLAVLLTASLFAQSPQKMSYQAVIRDGFGELVQSHAIGMQISILKDENPVFVETHSAGTNENGLVTIEIGGGTFVSGVAFSAIDWSDGTYFIKTETDPTGGTNYTAIVGTSQILSVPYALHAKTAASYTETDPVFGVHPTNGISGADITNWTTAYNWGNHASAGYLTSVDGSETKVTAGTNVTVTGAGTTATPYVVNATGQSSGTVTGQMQYWNGSAWVVIAATVNEGAALQMISGVPTWVGGTLPPQSVTNPTTGKIWLDRNLGATQVATSSTDANSYGHLYEWGRGNDGHQIRTSGTTTTLSGTDVPGHADFILASSSPYDWRSPQNTNLWQGVNGVNNPCPAGYRIPTETELDAERASWSSQNAAGAFASQLKLPAAGIRSSNGSIGSVGAAGYYWSSTVSSTSSRSLYFLSTYAGMNTFNRVLGNSVRCIKD